jgi:hypothetical protein
VPAAEAAGNVITGDPAASAMGAVVLLYASSDIVDSWSFVEVGKGD